MSIRGIIAVTGLMLCVATGAHAQALDFPFQVRAVPSLKGNDAIVVSYNGASGQSVPSMCVNVYAFSASSGAMLDCCNCLVPADAMATIPIISDLLEKPKVKPKQLVLKLMASTGTAFACDASAVGTGANVLATGMLAWKGGTPFTPSTLSAAELTSIDNQCAGIHSPGRVCTACVPAVM
jgi:hypothetical protein